MATPMSYTGPDEFMCALCFEGTLNEYATFDMHDWPGLVRVNICPSCRMTETHWMIRGFASYDGYICRPKPGH